MTRWKNKGIWRKEITKKLDILARRGWVKYDIIGEFTVELTDKGIKNIAKIKRILPKRALENLIEDYYKQKS